MIREIYPSSDGVRDANSVERQLQNTTGETAKGSDRGYWLCQLLGWCGYGVAYYLAILVPFRESGMKQALADFAYCMAGLLGTHFLRLRMKNGVWSNFEYRKLAPHLIFGALLAGLFQAIVLDSTLTAEHLLPWTRTSYNIAVLMSTSFFSAFLVGLWLAIYFVIQGTRRRREAEVSALRAQVLAREAQMRSLRQQLNPHFLFNCLNGLRGMIDEDRGRAQEIVTRLAELLRYSLRPDERGTVALDDELAIVDAYLDLESMRLEERLRIRREIDPVTRTADFPPMLLQGLVENALKHGISRIPTGGELTLTVTRRADVLFVWVTNTGSLQTVKGHGIGLANARERLRLLYGDRARLSLSGEPPGCVSAALEIPFQEWEAV